MLTVTYLAERFMVSRSTIYKILKQGRRNLFVPLASKNERYRTIKYGIKRLAKIGKSIEEKLGNRTREYLFVGIDDFPRELYAGIYPDKSQFSTADCLRWGDLE